MKYSARWRAETTEGGWCVIDDSTGKRICTVSSEWVAQKMIAGLLASAPKLRERNEELELQNRQLRDLLSQVLRVAQVDIFVRDPMLQRVLASLRSELGKQRKTTLQTVATPAPARQP